MAKHGLRDPGRSVGIWAAQLRKREGTDEAAAELEQLGFAALWVPGGLKHTFAVVEPLLAATRSLTVATGIANIWVNPPQESARETARLNQNYAGRFLLGLGVSHAPAVEGRGLGHYERPLARMSEYLTALDHEPQPVPVTDRVLAALGPKMLDLAAQRSLGTHPYLVTPEMTAWMRERVGPGARVLVEQGVVLEPDRDRARELAQQALAPYLELPNYVNAWLRAGLDLDKLIDSLIVLGGPDELAARVAAHHDAGADHVCVQVLGTEPGKLPMAEWRRVAEAVGSS